MNVILFTKSRGSSRQIDLKQPRIMLTTLALVSLIASAVFVTGYYYAGQTMQIDPDVRVVELKQVIGDQETDLAEVRKTQRENLDALSARIGQLQANVIRLNALGARLAQMADLSDGEFDFTSQPGLGGPQLHSGRTSQGVADLNQELGGLETHLVSRQQQLDVLEDMLMTRNLHEQVHPEGWPLASGWVSSYFGMRTDPFTGKRARHDGLDFAGREGTPIMAVGAGVVTWSSTRFGYGNLVEINHGGGYVTRYAHNKENLVAVGDRVEKGQLIAYMGSTGRATGANLHFEVMHKSRPVDPLDFIGERH